MLIVKRTGSVSRRHLATENFSEWFLWVKSHLAKIWKSWIRWTYRCQSIWQSWNLLFTGPEVFEFVRWWEVGTNNCRDTLEILNYISTRALCGGYAFVQPPLTFVHFTILHPPTSIPMGPMDCLQIFEISRFPLCATSSISIEYPTIPLHANFDVLATINNLVSYCNDCQREFSTGHLWCLHEANHRKGSSQWPHSHSHLGLRSGLRWPLHRYSVSRFSLWRHLFQCLSSLHVRVVAREFVWLLSTTTVVFKVFWQLCSFFTSTSYHNNEMSDHGEASSSTTLPCQTSGNTHQRQSTCKRKLWTSASTSSNNSERTRSWNPKQHSCSNRSYLMKPSRRTRLSWLTGGPGKLLMFGVRKNPKIHPQIRKVIALKSAHLDRAYHVISKKGNYLDFYNVRISIHPASRNR